MGENDFVNWLRQRLPAHPPSVLVGSGPDDCAILDVANETTLAITTDTLVEGTHFASDDSPRDIGWKAIAVSLSDLAASGCAPGWAVIGAGLGNDRNTRWAQDLVLGMLDAANDYGLSIIGGDTTTCKGPTNLTVTAFGTPMGKRPLLRSGAKPGDLAVVTGALGGSLLGRHLRPTPRLREMDFLLKVATLHGAMDISDGLALDLNRLCRESGCGVLIDEDYIPVHADAVVRSHTTGQSPLHHALSDGEDFELLLAMTPTCWDKALAAWEVEFPDLGLHRIGTFSASKACEIATPAGVQPLEPQGYEHRFDSDPS